MREKHKNTFLETFYLRFKQLSINVIIMCGLTGIGYLVWFSMDQVFEHTYSPVLSAVFINVMMIIIPICLTWIVQCVNVYLTLF